jgi:serine-type D-Ala-D-Ala carboxypeptidase (penicillin-binding protein 5/6)
MSRNIKIFLATFVISIPFWLGVNAFSGELENYFFWHHISTDPHMLKAQASSINLETQLFSMKPRLKHNVTQPQIQADAAYSVFVDTDGKEKILFEKNSKRTLPIASISKLMTALLVLEHYDLDQVIRIRQEILDVEGNSGSFRYGDDFTAHDLLYPLLIESSNDAAVALAQTKGLQPFVAMMNEKAQQLNLSNTVFVNPTGLDPDYPDQKINYSTAVDLSTLSQYLHKNHPEIFDILALGQFTLSTPEGFFHHTIYNTNDLLQQQKWREIVIGGKTGWTPIANGALLLVVKSPKDDGYIVHIVLGSDDRFEEMKLLHHWVTNSHIW